MNTTQTPFELMHKKISEMSDHDLDVVWKALGTQDWGVGDIYQDGILMDDWATAVSNELFNRNWADTLYDEAQP